MNMSATVNVSNHAIHKGVERFLGRIDIEGKNWEEIFWTILPFLNNVQNIARKMLMETVVIKRVAFTIAYLKSNGYDRIDAIIALDLMFGVLSQSKITSSAKDVVNEACRLLDRGLPEI